MLIQTEVIGSFMLPVFLLSICRFRDQQTFFQSVFTYLNHVQRGAMQQFSSVPLLPEDFIIQSNLLIKCMVEK